MTFDQVDDALLDVRPDRGARDLTGRLAGQVVGGRPHRAHVRDRHHHVHVDLLGRRRLHDGDRTPAGQEPGHLLDRADRGGQPDPLRGPVQQRVEPVQRDRQMGAALGAGDGVHLVDDHGADTAQHFPGPAGEQQEQRFRCGDQDVGAVPGERAPVPGRGVAGPDRDGDLRQGDAAARRHRAHPGQRRAQVPLHVDGQGLQRRQVEHRAPLRRRRLGGSTRSLRRTGAVRQAAGHQIVDGGQERRQRLARSGRRDDQGVLAPADGVPGPGLGGGRRGERVGEPVPDQRVEPSQRLGRVRGRSHRRTRRTVRSVRSRFRGCAALATGFPRLAAVSPVASRRRPAGHLLIVRPDPDSLRDPTVQPADPVDWGRPRPVTPCSRSMCSDACALVRSPGSSSPASRARVSR